MSGAVSNNHDGDSVTKFLSTDFLGGMFIKILEPVNILLRSLILILSILTRWSLWGTQTQLQLKLQMCWRVPLPHLIEFIFFLQLLDTCINKIDVQTPATMES